MLKRFHFLDNLRGVAILMVVALHVFLCYMAYAPEWWFVIDPKQSMFFTYGVVLIDVPVMPIMFFIAGYFAFTSLDKHGVRQFWVAKFRRIVVPWIFGVVVLSPPAMYMILLSRDTAPDFWTFFTDVFWSKMFSQSVFWFLGLLVLFYALLTLCYEVSDRFRTLDLDIKKPGILFTVFFIAVNSGCFLLLNYYYPVDFWKTDLYLIMLQPVRFFLYVFYFFLGVLAWKRGWFQENGYMPKLIPWLLASVISAFIYVHYKMQMPMRGTEFLIKSGNALWFNVFAYSTMMACFAVFYSFFNSANRIWRSFSDSSYGIYLLHSLVVYYGAYFLLNLDASPYVKAEILLTSSVLVCWVLTLLLKRNNVLARII